MNSPHLSSYVFRPSLPGLTLLQIQNAEFDEFILFSRYLGANQRQIDRILDTYYVMQALSRRSVESRARDSMILHYMIRHDLFQAEPYPHIMHMRKECQHGQPQS